MAYNQQSQTDPRRDGPTYLDTVQAAAYLALSRKSLEAWRARGQGPVYCKLHGLRGLIRYRRVDLDRFMESRLVGEGIPEIPAGGCRCHRHGGEGAGR
jgi:hypothetical protein